jgi:hypothetical protein
MAEFLKGGSLRYSNDGQRFLRALWLISALALLILVLSLVTDWLTASRNYLSDGAPWIYDTVIYGLVALSFDRGAVLERVAGAALSLILAVAGCQGSYDVWSEIFQKAPELSIGAPCSGLLFATGASLEAMLLFRFRASRQPLMKGAWLSARNSALIGLAGAAAPFLSHTQAAADPQILVDGLDTFLAFQAAFLIAREVVDA